MDTLFFIIIFGFICILCMLRLTSIRSDYHHVKDVPRAPSPAHNSAATSYASVSWLKHEDKDFACPYKSVEEAEHAADILSKSVDTVTTSNVTLRSDGTYTVHYM